MSRYVIDLVDKAGNEASVEVRIRRDTVELWAYGRMAAIFHRSQLRRWLADPEGVLVVDDVTWALLGDRLGLSIDPFMSWWSLEGYVLDDLRQRV
jgi:hypothetical protein